MLIIPAMNHPELPHKLDLYRLAVQCPQADVAFLERVYARANGGRLPQRLKEDFAGSSELAITWILLDPQRQAVAVEQHSPTLRWATRRAGEQLGHAADRVTFVQDDVMQVSSPQVDVVASLNFSTFVYHDRASLLAYFKHARQSLHSGGVLVIDAYGGPGAMRPMVQTRQVAADDLPGVDAFEYQWEQVSYDAAVNRVDNRIHFQVGPHRMENAFRYRWRLWTLAELREAMIDAGFATAAIWCDRYDPKANTTDQVYRPMTRIVNREDWVAYVVAVV